jgi:Glycoside hydrolase family 44
MLGRRLCVSSLARLAVVLGAVGSAGAQPSSEVRLEVQTDRDNKPISPLIYGTNLADPGSTRWGLLRHGGNRLTAYNWENNASNAGSDWHFQNDGLLSSDDTPGAALAAVLAKAQKLGAAALLTVPIIDHVAADKLQGGDVRKSGPNFLATRFKKNAPKKDGPFTLVPDPKDAYVYQDEMVAWVKAKAPKQQVLFSLDNEPELWAKTHAPLHPKKVEYQELCTRNVTYAQAVKRVWPEAEVLGFVSYGWHGLKTLEDAPDRAGKGEFVDYYLECLKAAEAAAGRRVVDTLDVHWYPEAQGGGARIVSDNVSPAVVAARLQAPRSLWDPSYVEDSWITNKQLKDAVRLLPRLKEKIAKGYPGTRLAVSEWNYGGGHHISGALAVADVLGIFGREGVGLAAYWPMLKDESFAQAGFEAYRDFDGAGGGFGDTSVRATTSDAAGVSLYGSVMAGDPNKVVLVVINKGTAPRRARIGLGHPKLWKALQSFRLQADAPRFAPGPEIPSGGANVFQLELPPLSVTVLRPLK